MKRRSPVVVVVCLLAAIVGCSSSDDANKDNCPDAKSAVDGCNSHGSTQVTFDEQECEQGDSAKKAAAACLAANKDSCGCMVPCIQMGSCG